MHESNVSLSTLAEEIISLANEQGLTIASAESCTGGGIAQTLTSIPGASAVFDTGVVTYSNTSKQNLLGVKTQTLQMHGAVSKKTAQEMAMGTMSYGVDIGVSVTGIAGPGGGSEHKPVGTVCFGLADRRKTLVRSYKEHFSGNRASVQEQAIRHALLLILNTVKK